MSSSSRKQTAKTIKRHTVNLGQVPELALLPTSIDVGSYWDARETEVQYFEKEIGKEAQQGRSTRRTFQQLPRGMRRRTASHDLKRLPVRLRQKAAKEMDPVTNDACRRKKRRPRQIRQFYAHRAATWLSTHLWHAKRAHMQDLWGVRIAEKSNAKALKPSFRAAKEGCFLVDYSYYSLLDAESSFEMAGRHEIVHPNGKWQAVHPAIVSERKPFSIFRLFGPKATIIVESLFQQSLAPLMQTSDPRGRSFKKATKQRFDSEAVVAEAWCKGFFSEDSKLVSEVEVNILRSKAVIPGANVNLRDTMYGLTSQQPDGSLWLIVPDAWALIAWRALIFSGAQFGGQKELAFVEHELGRPFFPADFPGTEAHKAYALKRRDDLLAAYHKKPASKRGVNFEKVGIVEPFISPFTPDMNQQYKVIPLGRCRFDIDDGLATEDGTIVGYVTHAGFSQRLGRLAGFATASKGGDLHLIDRNHGINRNRKVRLEPID